MEWYKTLSIHQKINLKSICSMIVGIEFASMTMLFGLKDSINLIHQKLLIENILPNNNDTRRD